MQATHVDRTDAHVSTLQPGWIARAVIAGFAATLVMLLFFLLAYGLAWFASTVTLAGRRGAETLHLWLYNLTNNQLIDTTKSNVYLAVAIYVAGGLVWAIIYAALAEPRLRGSGWLRGAVFSVIPGILSLVVFLPLVGGGMLGSALGAGPLPIIGNLLLHLVYGMTLGQLYGPFGDIDATTLEGPIAGADVAAMLSSERMAARGLFVGLILGVMLGVAGAIAAGIRPDDKLLGQPPIAILLATAISGGTVGILVGSFLGLSGVDDSGRAS